MLKKFIWILSPIIVIAMLAAAAGWWLLYSPNTVKSVESNGYILFITPEHTLADIEDELTAAGILKCPWSFRKVGLLSRSGEKIKPGRYRISAGMNNYSLFQKFRNGLQHPVRFTFNNLNYIEDFCGVAGSNFGFDSLDIIETVRDKQFLDSLGIRPEMFLGYMLPNTYEVYWTISPKGLIIRMLKESDIFWNNQRIKKLQERGLEKEDVLIIASIIQKETNHIDEMSRMAGVFINRLGKGMKLQADPTVKYAVGDLTIRRVQNIHLEYPSPYNTYYSYGLPPGVICAPNPVTIDKVLDYEEHDYLFFVAKPGYNSKHAFAVTGTQHMQNSRKYRAWLNSEGIR